MELLFFDAADAPLFARGDAEKIEHNHEDMSLTLLFPYVAGKEIRRGMRVGYRDILGEYRAFEIRMVKTYEPDHYQEITAENIAISELTDEFVQQAEVDNKTAVEVLTQYLAGTLWAVGNVDSAISGTSSANIGTGDLWGLVRTVENNWNVYIIPRVTVDSGGITGRYLDVYKAGGTWRGLRLSLEKNADEVGVTWDDQELKTALYGFGRAQTGSSSTRNPPPLTFENVVWSVANGDPVDKPAGQAYVEDPAATALYGRNGRKRYGYYQNGDISDPEILLQKTWESLQLCNKPQVQIECRVLDLHKFGYADQPIVLHDTALVEITPTGEILTNEIIRYTEDLLEPQNSRVTIGAYIPNIIYINRQTAKRSSGGKGSGKSDDNKDYDYETWITANEYQIQLGARHLTSAYAAIGISSDNIETMVTGSGVMYDQQGNIILDANGYPVFSTNTGIFTKTTQNAANWSTLVQNIGANGTVTAASIALSVNANGSNAIIAADHVQLSGNTTISGMLAVNGSSLVVGQGNATIVADTLEARFCDLSYGVSAQYIGTNAMNFNGEDVEWLSQEVVTGISVTMPSVTRSSTRNFMYAVNGDTSNPSTILGSIITAWTNGSVSGPTKKTIYYLGRTVTNA